MTKMEAGSGSVSRRGFVAGLLMLWASACKARPKRVELNVVVYNYWDRPIFDVFVDGRWGGSSEEYPATGGGIIVGVMFELGPKTVSWRLDGPGGTPRNGETVVNKNPLSLSEVPKGAKYLGVHLYPDETVELTVSSGPPRDMKDRALGPAGWGVRG